MNYLPLAAREDPGAADVCRPADRRRTLRQRRHLRQEGPGPGPLGQPEGRADRKSFQTRRGADSTAVLTRCRRDGELATGKTADR